MDTNPSRINFLKFTNFFFDSTDNTAKHVEYIPHYTCDYDAYAWKGEVVILVVGYYIAIIQLHLLIHTWMHNC